MSPPIRDGSGSSIGSIRLGDGTVISEVRTGAGDVLFSGLPSSQVTLPNGNIAYQFVDTKEWNNFTNWTRKITGDSTLVSSPTHNGGSALRVSTGNSNPSAIISKRSLTDSPTEGQINSQWGNTRNNSHDIAGYFRFQDANNFLVVSYNGTNEVQLNERSNGSGTTLDSVGTNVGTPRTWVLHEIRLFEDSGTLKAEVESENKGIIGGTLSTTSNSITSGGGIGVGSSFFASGRGNNAKLYTDTTEVYYPE